MVLAVVICWAAALAQERQVPRPQPAEVILRVEGMT